ncbi:putative 2-oxoglutarate-dependent dioxygenase [Capsicum chinense]|nr:putative 2-oxoglutarate-dependent dioxygenase [Capsicum chinense]
MRKNKRFCDVVDVFEAMPEKNVVSHNAMLSLYLGIGDFMSARQKGHGIDVYLMNEIKNITREYFHQPLAEKNKTKLSAETGYRGYQKIEENINKGIPDIHEAIGCYREVKHGMYEDLGAVMQGSNKWPSYPPSFKQTMEQYTDHCTDLSQKIIRGIALALDGSTDEIEGEIGGDPFWVLRLIGYDAASISNGHDRTQNDVGCGAHTNYGLLTLFNQDDDIVTLQPNFDAAIEPLNVCLQKTGGTKNFEGAVYGKHLVSKVTTNFIL